MLISARFNTLNEPTAHFTLSLVKSLFSLLLLLPSNDGLLVLIPKKPRMPKHSILILLCRLHRPPTAISPR
ncbi:unnamed protein product, partial [Nesidiocoris tenuis]